MHEPAGGAACHRARPVRRDRRPPLGRRSTVPGAVAARAAGRLRERRRAAAGARRPRRRALRRGGRARELHPRRRRAERRQRPRPRRPATRPGELPRRRRRTVGEARPRKSIHRRTKRRANCVSTTTASNSLPASISSWRAWPPSGNRPPDTGRPRAPGPVAGQCGCIRTSASRSARRENRCARHGSHLSVVPGAGGRDDDDPRHAGGGRRRRRRRPGPGPRVVQHRGRQPTRLGSARPDPARRHDGRRDAPRPGLHLRRRLGRPRDARRVARLWRGEPKPAPSWSLDLRPEVRPADRTGTSEPVPPGHVGDWSRARERFHRVRAEYAAYECDPILVLRLPALADVSVASTARFVDAFAEAQALETDALPRTGARPAVRRGRGPRRADLDRRAGRGRTDPAHRARARRAPRRGAGRQAAHHRPRLRQRTRAPGRLRPGPLRARRPRPGRRGARAPARPGRPRRRGPRSAHRSGAARPS